MLQYQKEILQEQREVGSVLLVASLPLDKQAHPARADRYCKNKEKYCKNKKRCCMSRYILHEQRGIQVLSLESNLQTHFFLLVIFSNLKGAYMAALTHWLG